MKNPSDKWADCVVTFLGLGKLPIMPGTWGTLGALLIHALAARFIGTSDSPWFLPALAAVFALACLVYGPWAEKFYGRKDPNKVVIDEVAGYLLAVSFFPYVPQPLVGALAFLPFRLFDIVKPFPARRSQKLSAGLGIVADDLIAGLYTALLVWLLLPVFTR